MPFLVFVFVSIVVAGSTIAATMALSERPIPAVLAATAGATTLLLFHGIFFDFYHDDAYIALRYSRHLADGLGPNWNSVGRVEGYTSFAWMGVLGGLGKLGFDLVDASRALSFLALLGTFIAVYGIWELWSREEPESGLASPILFAAVLLGLALTDSVAFWGFSGLETPLFIALVTGSAYLYLRERRGGQLPWSAVVLATCAMTRPEGLIVVGVTAIFKAVDALGKTDRRMAMQELALWAGVVAVLYGSYFVWRYAYYGYLLPNTFYAKVEPDATLFDRGLSYVISAGRNYHLLAMFVGTALLIPMTRLGRDAAYIIALTGLVLVGIIFEGGDDFGAGRFVVPVLPLLFLSGLGGFAVMLRRASLTSAQFSALASAALVLGALALLPLSHNPHLPSGRQAQHERATLGTWLNQNTPESFTIAAFAVGSISYHAHARDFLDLFGLNDVTIAHTDVGDLGPGFLGHEKYNIDYVLDEVAPEIIVFADASEGPVSDEEAEISLRRLTPIEARNKLFNDPRLWARYRVRSLNIDGTWFNFLQRVDTIAQLQAEGLS